ncbi:MAG: hypothetical protein IKW13_06510 [Thermoguttaceae bacterium]|nr:hypothetical protein [Thermoguttaceae bacterium]
MARARRRREAKGEGRKVGAFRTPRRSISFDFVRLAGWTVEVCSISFAWRGWTVEVRSISFAWRGWAVEVRSISFPWRGWAVEVRSISFEGAASRRRASVGKKNEKFLKIPLAEIGNSSRMFVVTLIETLQVAS